jgi:hypothetical protein
MYSPRACGILVEEIREFWGLRQEKRWQNNSLHLVVMRGKSGQCMGALASRIRFTELLRVLVGRHNDRIGVSTYISLFAMAAFTAEE